MENPQASESIPVLNTNKISLYVKQLDIEKAIKSCFVSMLVDWKIDMVQNLKSFDNSVMINVAPMF